MKAFNCFLLFIIFSVALIAASENDRFESANQAYQKRNFEVAISTYETLLSEGYTSSALLYNLGNAYWKSGKLGRAILNYERALKISPNDADVLHNLEILNAELRDEIEPLPAFFLANWWSGLASVFPGNIWGILSIVFFWLVIAGVYYWLFGKDRQIKKKGFLAVIGFAIFTILTVSLAYSKLKALEDRSQAIIQETEIPLMSAPDEESVKIFDLHEGTKLIILDNIGEWIKVRLLNGDQGWLKEETVERI